MIVTVQRQRELEEEERHKSGEREKDIYAEKEMYSDKEETAAASLDQFDLGEKVTGPKQAKLHYYPQEHFGLQKRSFQSNWFQVIVWLEYSEKKDSAYCCACRVFGKNLKHDVFVSSGFKNWKQALNAFLKYEGTQSHKDCIVSWNSYKASSLRGNVVQQIKATSADEIRQRREYMRHILAVTCVLGKQGLHSGVPMKQQKVIIRATSWNAWRFCRSLILSCKITLPHQTAPTSPLSVRTK